MQLIKRKADTQMLTALKSHRSISSLLSLQATSLAGEQAWFTGVEGPGRKGSQYITPPPPPSFYSLPLRLWTAMYMRCSHLNLSQSESPRLTPLLQRDYLT